MLYSSITSYQLVPANSGVSVDYYLSRNTINSTFLSIADYQNALQY